MIARSRHAQIFSLAALSLTLTLSLTLSLSLLAACGARHVAVQCSDGSYCPEGTICLPNGGGCANGSDSGVTCEPAMCPVMGVCVANDTNAGCGPACLSCTETSTMSAQCVMGSCVLSCKVGTCMLANGQCTDPMKDPNNCGMCGHKCKEGGCNDGMCVPVTVAQGNQPAGIAVAADGTVYWAENLVTGRGSIMRASPGMNPMPFVSNLTGPRGLAIDGTNLYWTEDAGGAGGSVALAALSDGVRHAIATTQTSPDYITVAAGYVYWTTDITVGQVFRVPIATPLATELVADNQSHPHGVLVDSSTKTAYWVNSKSDQVQSTPVAGMGMAPITNYHSGAGAPEQIAFDATNQILYWTESVTNGSVSSYDIKANKAGASFSGQDFAYGITARMDSVFWTVHRGSRGNGAVLSAPKGGSPTVIADHLQQPSYIVVDDNFIYWTNAVQGGLVEKVSR